MATIRLKRGTTAGYIPTGLTWGEPAVNTTDGILFCGNTYGNTVDLSGVLSFNGLTGHITHDQIDDALTLNVVGLSASSGITGNSTLYVGSTATFGENVNVDGTIYMAGGLRHIGDTNTKVVFTSGTMTLSAGPIFMVGTSAGVDIPLGLSAAGTASFNGPVVMGITGTSYLQFSNGNTQGRASIEYFSRQGDGSPFYSGQGSITDIKGIDISSDDIAIAMLNVNAPGIPNNTVRYILSLGSNVPKLDEINTFTNASGNVFTTPIGSNRYAGHSAVEVLLASLDHAASTYMGVTAGNINFKVSGTEYLTMDSSGISAGGETFNVAPVATFGGNVVASAGITLGAEGITFADGVGIQTGSSVVVTSGNQTISGTKTFSSVPQLSAGLSASGASQLYGGVTFGNDIYMGGNYHIRNSAGASIMDFEGDRNFKVGDIDSAGNDSTIYIRDSHSSINMTAGMQIDLNSPTVYIPENLTHKGDGHTKLTFGADTISLLAGGVTGQAITTTGTNFADLQITRPELKDYAETVNAIGTITGNTAIDFENGNVQTVTGNGDCEFTFTNPPASGKAGTVTLIITNGGANTTTWHSSVKWPGDNAPALTASGTDIVSFMTIDAGTTIYGFVGGINFS